MSFKKPDLGTYRRSFFWIREGPLSTNLRSMKWISVRDSYIMQPRSSKYLLQISLFLCLILVSSTRSQSAETRLLVELLNTTEYDFAVRPPGIVDAEDPCIVEIDVVMNSVGPVSSLEMEMTTSFYLRQEWVDPRLRFIEHELANKTISVSTIYADKLWIPDLFFTMGKESYRHELTTPNLLIRLQSDGTVLYSQRITSTMKCFMDLSYFPHDKQDCRAAMMSYSYTTDDLVFRWSSKRAATSVLPSAFLAEFTLSEVSVNDCTETFATGTYTCLEAIFSLEREMGFYLTQTYIPSILIVMLSWAAFWIDHEAVPARISVGLLTVLTITTQSTGARAQLPRVSYVKAIDVWMSVNLVFVFTAYMEYAFVTVMSRRYKRMLRKSPQIQQRNESESSDQSSNRSIPNVSLSQPEQAESRNKSQESRPENDVRDTGNVTLFLTQSSLQETKQANQQQNNQNEEQQNYQPQSLNTAKCKAEKKNKGVFLWRQKSRQIFERNFGRRVDFHSRYLFPLSYLIFNIIYWTFYLWPR